MIINKFYYKNELAIKRYDDKNIFILIFAHEK